MGDSFKKIWAWDKKELEKIQLDEQTINRKYVTFWVTNTSNPDQVMKFKLEHHSVEDFVFKPEYEDHYQFLI